MSTPSDPINEAMKRAERAPAELFLARSRGGAAMTSPSELAPGEAALPFVSLPAAVLPILSRVADEALKASQTELQIKERVRDFYIAGLGKAEAALREARAAVAEATVLAAQMDEARAADRAATAQEQGV